MKAKVYAVVKTNGLGKVLSLDLYSSHHEAQEVVRAEYESTMVEAEKEGKSVTGCSYCNDFAWVELDWDDTKNYQWDIFECAIPKELL